MQRFIPGWRLAGRIEPDSEPSTISSTSKAIKTRHRTRTTRSTTSIGTTEALSFHSATPGLDAFTPLQLVTESSTSTTFSELSTSPSSTRAQPPETYFGTRIYSYPSSPLASPVTDPQSLVAFSPPVISVALVCSGTALIALVICVSLYRCSCAATRERENDHHNVKESPLFGGRDMNSEKYTVMGSLDSWESLQASLAHGMGRMPQAATSQSPQNTCPSSDPLTGMNECSWDVATGAGHPDGFVGSRGAGMGSTQDFIPQGPLGHSAGQVKRTHVTFAESTYAPTSNVTATADAQHHSRTPVTPSPAGPPFHQSRDASSRPSGLSPSVVPTWKRPNVPVTRENISRPALQSTTNFAVQPIISSSSATPKPLHSILKQNGSQSSSIPNNRTSRQPMMQSENRSLAPDNPPHKGSNSSHSAQRPTRGVRPLNAPNIYQVTRHGQLPATASQSGSSSSLTNESSGNEGQPLPRILDFPLPPDTSTPITSSSSMKLTSSDFKDKRRFSAASTAARRSRMLSGSTSGVLASVGDLMMRGYADSDVSGDETTDCENSRVFPSSAKRVAVPSSSAATTLPNNGGTGTASSGHRLPAVPTGEPAQNVPSVPSIMVTGTSVDSLKSLNRRMSRAQMGTGNSKLKASNTRQDHVLPPSRSLPAPSSGRAPGPSRSRFDSDDSAEEGVASSNTTGSLVKRALDRDRKSIASEDEWAPLSQMAFERAQPDYRSATYSIYNMYHEMEDEAGFMTTPLSIPMPAPVAPLELRGIKPKAEERDIERDISDMPKNGLLPLATPKTAKTVAMSTIYADYESSDEGDIGATFAREVGASLGRIR